MTGKLILLFIITLFLSDCSRRHTKQEARSMPDADVIQTTLSTKMPWLNEPSSRWEKDFSGSKRDSLSLLFEGDLEREGIGIKTRVYDTYDRWRLNEEVRGDRGYAYAEITEECKGAIELDFVLTQEKWQKIENRVKYYRAVDALIDKIGNAVLIDFGNELEGQEKEFFLRALKTLAWQESKWQHYLQYKNWFFVIVSGGSYNKLDDWGITQIARSSFDPNVLLNKNFFDSKGYCSISSGLYYGFMEYYYCYLEARENPSNGPSLFNKIVGAYNRYCSGYSSSYYELARNDEAYRNYQIRVMGGFKDNFILKPWKKLMNQSSSPNQKCKNYIFEYGGIIRGDTTVKKIAFIFTGGDFADGGQHIRTVLKSKRITVSFFFTGDFYRDPQKEELIRQLVEDGHYLGPHSDKHLLYCSWENRDSTLISKKQFVDDILENYRAMESFGIMRKDTPYFIPPYEWYNKTIVKWAKELDLILVNFTPGTNSNADYTTPDMPQYRSSQAIFNKILSYEQSNLSGLNGFLLLMHIGTDPARTDKFYFRLEKLIDILQKKGYSFVRIDELIPS